MKQQADSRAEPTIVGTRIRRRRHELGLSQTELAQRVDISPSYMNLIEWNKRQIAGTLLRKIAEALQLELDDLDSTAEHRLLETLNEIAYLPVLSNLAIEVEQTGELIGRFPGWARAVATLARSEHDAIALARALSDRLSNDPFLGETVHRMLTRIAAIRSASEILITYEDMTNEERDRFYAIVDEESRILSGVGEALAAYLDKADEPTNPMTPIDEVESMFDVCANRFEALEIASDRLKPSHFEPYSPARQDTLRQTVSKELHRDITAIIGDHPQIQTTAARERARRSLVDYAVGAVQMPMADFARQAAASRYDIEALADIYAVEIHDVCLRLTALPPEPNTPRFGYYRANAAGSMIRILGHKALTFPRYAPACPLWVLYRAQQSPEAVIRQRALFPSGARFVFVARARNTGPTGFGKPRHYVTDMLAMTENDARHTVYAPDSSALVEEVGPSCRLCPRQNCDHRVDDPLAD